MKLIVQTGNQVVTAAGTKEAIVVDDHTAAPFRAILLTISATADEGIIVGDTNVLWGTDTTRRGLVVSDGTGSSSSINSVTLSVPGSDTVGRHGAESLPYINLNELYVDAETSADSCWWFALCIG
jgi:hypothetical protein